MTLPRLFPRRGMAPMTRIASTANVADNASGFTIVRGADLGNPVTSGNEVRVGGWERHPVVHACVRAIVDIIAAVPFEVYRKDGNGEPIVQPKHEALQLLDEPNGPLSPYRLRARTATPFVVYGNAFWFLDRGNSRRGLPKKITPISPDRVTYAWTNAAGEIVKYDWRDANGNAHTGTPAEDIVHFRDLEARDGYFGYPRGAAALLDIDTDARATQYVRQMVNNHGVPGLVIITEGTHSPEDVRQAEAAWHEKMSARGERGRTKFVGGVKDVKPIGFDLAQLEFPDLRGIAREDICAAFGVDPRMIGIASAANDAGLSGAQFREARARLIQQTVTPIMAAMESELNTWLMPEFGDVWVRFAPDKVAAMTEDGETTSKRVMSEVMCGVRTVEEAREVVGLDSELDPSHHLALSTATLKSVRAALEDADLTAPEMAAASTTPPTSGMSGMSGPEASAPAASGDNGDNGGDANGGDGEFAVGARVRVRSGKAHDAMTKDAVGTVAEVGTEALGVKFDGMDEVHRWYVASELAPAEDAVSPADGTDGMEGM